MNLRQIENVAVCFQTLLSLAKLSALASGSDSDSLDPVLSRIDDAMSVVVAQEQLPKPVLRDSGLTSKIMRVLSPREIIEVKPKRQQGALRWLAQKESFNYLQHGGCGGCIV